MTFVFEFSEADTEKLRIMLLDCVGVDSYYDSLVAQFFSQLVEQERRQRQAEGGATTGPMALRRTGQK